MLSFKYREVNSDGTVRTGQPLVHHIGGSASWFTPTKIIYTNNGNQYHATPHADGSLSWSNPTLLPGNLNGELYIRAYFKTHAKENCSSVSDWNLYIQPGRPSDVYVQPVYCEIWDVKVEKGTIATGWQVAKKDTETFFNVDPSTGVITLQAANLLSLAGDEFEITSGNFQVTKEGVITATKGTIGGWDFSDRILSWVPEAGEYDPNATANVRNDGFYFSFGQGYPAAFLTTIYNKSTRVAARLRLLADTDGHGNYPNLSATIQAMNGYGEEDMDTSKSYYCPLLTMGAPSETSPNLEIGFRLYKDASQGLKAYAYLGYRDSSTTSMTATGGWRYIDFKNLENKEN